MGETRVYFLSAVFSSLFLLLLLPVLFNKLRRSQTKLPPSPTSFPIIGHLHLLKEPVHRTLKTLSERYGPVLYLLFGSRTVVVVSSPSAAEECFTKNDVILANRPHLLAVKRMAYNGTTLGTAPYGPLWRNLRRLTAHDVLSVNRLNASSSIRREEARILVKNLYDVSERGFARVEMKFRLQELSFNIITRIISGRRYFGVGANEDGREAKRFTKVIREMFELSGMADPVDFVPLLRLVDVRGVEKRMVQMHQRVDVVLQGLIDEHRASKESSCGERKTMIDSMLSLQASEPEAYSDDIIKGQLLTMLSAGTDTSAVTIEWTMSLLLNHPEIMKKARAELDAVIGQDHLADEADIHKLPYLQNIVHEGLRLFPPAPLLVAHEASEACTIAGYDVPAGTMVLVNAWAIHRDPKVWDDSESFKPERFETSEGDVHAYRLIPFGMGRRSCPGAGLANRVVCLALAVLIQCFEWERVGKEPVDLSEGSGLTMPKILPLEAMCKARESMIPNVLAHL